FGIFLRKSWMGRHGNFSPSAHAPHNNPLSQQLNHLVGSFIFGSNGSIRWTDTFSFQGMATGTVIFLNFRPAAKAHLVILLNLHCLLILFKFGRHARSSPSCDGITTGGSTSQKKDEAKPKEGSYCHLSLGRAPSC